MPTSFAGIEKKKNKTKQQVAYYGTQEKQHLID